MRLIRLFRWSVLLVSVSTFAQYADPGVDKIFRPDEVAEIALNGMFANKSEIIAGLANIISVYANRILPKGFIEKMAAGIYKT